MRRLLSVAVGIWAVALGAIFLVQIAILAAFDQTIPMNVMVASSLVYSAVLVLLAYPASYFLLFQRLLAEIDHARRTEEMLRASEANYRSIFDAANDAILILNPATGAILDANRRMTEMFGYDRDDALRLTVGDIGSGAPPYSPEDARQWIRKAVEGRSQLFDWLARDRSGRAIWVEVNLKRAVIGGQDRLLAIVRDITERKQAEAEKASLLVEIQSRAAELEATINSVADGLIVFDSAGRVVRLNPAGEETLRSLSGDLPSSLLGMALMALPFETPEGQRFPLEERPAFKALRGARVRNALMKLVLPERQVNWLSVSSAPIRSPEGEIVGGVATYTNITELRELQEQQVKLTAELHRRAAQLQVILDNMVECVLVCDNTERLTLVNQSAARLLGLADPSQPNLSLKELLELVRDRFPDGRPMNIADLPPTRALRGAAVVNEDQIVYSPPRHRDLYVRTSAVPLRGADGGIVGAVSVVHDITEIAELDRLKDQFISVAAHELKTPIAVMRGYAQMLLQRPDNLHVAQRRMLDAINRGTHRIARTIEEMLDISQLQQGRLELSLSQIDLLQLVEQTAADAALLTTKHRLRIVSAQPATTQGDLDRLRQVLDNFIDNAIRFSPNGGDIDIVVALQGEEAVVSVRDQGVGIPKDKQAHMFQRFFRAHTGTPNDYGGIGVGLFISKEILALHGGRIWFESEEGQGSTFYFSLPVTGRPPKATGASPSDS